MWSTLLAESILDFKFLGEYAWLNEVYSTLPIILYAILSVVGGAGAIYAIILGVNLAKADSEDARKKASERLRNTIIGVAVLLFLVLFINVLLPLILKAFLSEHTQPKTETMIGILNMIIK